MRREHCIAWSLPLSSSQQLNACSLLWIEPHVCSPLWTEKQRIIPAPALQCAHDGRKRNLLLQNGKANAAAAAAYDAAYCYGKLVKSVSLSIIDIS